MNYLRWIYIHVNQNYLYYTEFSVQLIVCFAAALSLKDFSVKFLDYTWLFNGDLSVTSIHSFVLAISIHG